MTTYTTVVGWRLTTGSFLFLSRAHGYYFWTLDSEGPSDNRSPFLLNQPNVRTHGANGLWIRIWGDFSGERERVQV